MTKKSTNNNSTESTKDEAKEVSSSSSYSDEEVKHRKTKKNNKKKNAKKNKQRSSSSSSYSSNDDSDTPKKPRSKADKEKDKANIKKKDKKLKNDKQEEIKLPERKFIKFSEYQIKDFGSINQIDLGNQAKQFIYKQISKKLYEHEVFELDYDPLEKYCEEEKWIYEDLKIKEVKINNKKINEFLSDIDASKVAIHTLYSSIRDKFPINIYLTDNGYAIYTKEYEYKRFLKLISNIIVGKFKVEASGYLHILLCTQIRNWIYHAKKDKEVCKHGSISCKDAFNLFTKLYDDENNNNNENIESRQMIIDSSISEIIYSKCEFIRENSNLNDDYFDFEFEGSYHKYEAICDFIRKFQQILKSHALIGGVRIVRDATDYLYFKHIHEILGKGEMILNSQFMVKKDTTFLRPNVVLRISKIELKGEIIKEENKINTNEINNNSKN